MRLESIRIVNYRQFKDFTINFGRKEEKPDLHIIWAKNGVGKTNILNAITWCLYGYENHLQDQSTAKPLLNTEVINEARLKGISRKEALVEITISTDDGKIVFKRVADFIIGKNKVIQSSDNLIIKKMGTGGWDAITDEETQLEIKNKYLPQTIFDYIFFDGEQLGKFFASNQMKNVRNGINELTQAEYIRKSAKAIRDYIKDELTPKISSSTDQAVALKQNEVTSLKNNIEETERRIEQYECQIKTCDIEIAKRDRLIHGEESIKDKMEAFQGLEQQLIQKGKYIEDLKKNIAVCVRQTVQNVYIFPEVNLFYEYIKLQEEEGALPPKIDKNILETILEKGRCPICNSIHIDQDYINRLLSKIKIATNTSSILNRAIGSLPMYFVNKDNCKIQLDTLKVNLEQNEKAYEELEEKRSSLERILRQYPDKEEIAKAIEERSDFKKQRDKFIGDKTLENSHKEELEKELIVKEAELKKLISKHNALKKVNSQIEFLEKCKLTLDKTLDEVISECRKEIQEETFRIFCELIWKKNEFSDIEIDENYQLILRDQFGDQSLGSCSAAETMLLALSFTLALQDISKHDSLLFIDTPIGRVDDENRHNTMETLMKVSEGKQVILTFTPTEFDIEIQNIIGDEYSSFSQLIMNQGQTHIERK